MIRARHLFGLALVLWALALGRDGVDRMILATVLPPLQIDSSVEVVDRAGTLLRPYVVADGRWRMAVTPDEVDAGTAQPGPGAEAPS